MSNIPAAPYTKVIDTKVLAGAVEDVTRRVAALAPQMMAKQAADLESSLADEFGVHKAFGEVVQKMMADPALMAEAQAKYASDCGQLWQQTIASLSGQGPTLRNIRT